MMVQSLGKGAIFDSRSQVLSSLQSALRSRVHLLLCFVATIAVGGCGDPVGEDVSPDDAVESESELSSTDGRISVVFRNFCGFNVTVGTGTTTLRTIAPGASYERVLPGGDDYKPSIRYWGYGAGLFPGFGHMSLAEFTFNAADGNDYYDVSYVDAYNLPMMIRALNNASCRVVGCPTKFLSMCPSGNRKYVNGSYVACTKWGDRDNPNNPVTRMFESYCPTSVYSWSKDDIATAGCRSQDYRVTFCP